MSLYPLPGPLSIPIHIMGPLIHTCTLGSVPISITRTLTHTSPCYWDPCLYVLSGSPPISVPTNGILTSFCYEISTCTCYSEPRPARPCRYLVGAVGGADGTAVVQDDAPGPRQHQRRRHLRSGPSQPRHQHRRPGQPPCTTAQHIPAGTGGGRQRGPAPLPCALPRRAPILWRCRPAAGFRTHSCREYRNSSSLPAMTAPPARRPRPGEEPIP